MEVFMKIIHLRPADLGRDFGQLAALFSREQDEPTTEPGLIADYEENKDRIIRLVVAEDEQGALMGFNWAVRNRVNPSQVTIYLIVKPEQRGQGAGRRLYEDLAQAAAEAQGKELLVSIRDDSPESRAFAERRGFVEQRHQIAMALDLQAFDDRPYEAVIAKLKAEGFQFTSMAELGDTADAQRKLFNLNDSSASATPGSEGEHPWASFEDFQKHVCQTDWYHPEGQIIAIDTATGAWAAMSAITRWKEADFAYNLFTGVDLPYRGRKLGQAVKVLALRYARLGLKVGQVRTHHNMQNAPMIAIDRKLGYTQLPGVIRMVKKLA
jgi:GNAT superfamily N-acetyltransferase